MPNRTSWRLADYYDVSSDSEEFPFYIINTVGELRNHLLDFAGGAPRIVELYSPSGGFLRLGIGGPHAGLALVTLPIKMKILVSLNGTAAFPVSFESQGQPCTLRPDELHPPLYVIDLACCYYVTSCLPQDLQWRDY